MYKIVYPNKESLLKSKKPTETIYLADEYILNCPTRQYLAFETYFELISFLQSVDPKESHIYEIIPDTTNYSTFLFFDVDRYIYPECDADILKDKDTYFDKLIQTFNKKLETFLFDCYNIIYQPLVGDNCHICYSLTDAKISCHIKYNIKLRNLEHNKALAINFIQYVSNHSSDLEKLIFYYKNNAQTECIIDHSVYKNFQNIRVVRFSKNKTGATPLLPYKGSSTLIKDHLVLYHCEAGINYKEFGNQLHEDIINVSDEANHKTQYSSIIVRAQDLSITTKTNTVQGKLRDTIIDDIQRHLMTDDDISKLLGGVTARFSLPKTDV